MVSLLSIEKFGHGETPSRYFFVARPTQDADEPFELVPFAEASQSQASLKLPLIDAVLRTAKFETIEYHLIEASQEAPTIETIRADDNYVFTSRYHVEGQRVVPLMHNILGPGRKIHRLGIFPIAGAEGDGR